MKNIKYFENYTSESDELSNTKTFKSRKNLLSKYKLHLIIILRGKNLFLKLIHMVFL